MGSSHALDLLFNGKLPEFPQDAENFVLTAKEIDNDLDITRMKIEFADYSENVWNAALKIIRESGYWFLLKDYAGHYAEIIAINHHEPFGRVTRMVTDFIRKY